MRLGSKCAMAVALAALCAPLAAQQEVPFNNGIPVAPTGLAVPPLPDEPVVYQTAEGQDIRVAVHMRGLKRPWSLAFLPGTNDMLVTERGGQLRLVCDGVLDPEPVAGVPLVRAQGLSGLFDIALHPHFESNRFVYLTYNKPVPGGAVLGLARGTWTGKALKDVRDIFVSDNTTSSVSRLAFGRDGMLYVTTFGSQGENAQNPNAHAGKVLRLRDDGTIPDDNPFVGKPHHKPEVFTLGHRSTLGLAVHPVTGDIWQNENGPNGGDEINVLVPGGNYGWPVVSLGRTYPGPWQSRGFSKDGYIDPIVHWTPSIAVSGMAFYTGDKLPKWKGDVFVGSLRQGEIPGTGHLERILFNENMEELRREQLLTDLRRRIRDVRQGPDELLYLLTDEDNGAILRIEPAS